MNTQSAQLDLSRQAPKLQHNALLIRSAGMGARVDFGWRGFFYFFGT